MPLTSITFCLKRRLHTIHESACSIAPAYYVMIIFPKLHNNNFRHYYKIKITVSTTPTPGRDLWTEQGCLLSLPRERKDIFFLSENQLRIWLSSLIPERLRVIIVLVFAHFQKLFALPWQFFRDQYTEFVLNKWILKIHRSISRTKGHYAGLFGIPLCWWHFLAFEAS